jgi:hypothetical protein
MKQLALVARLLQLFASHTVLLLPLLWAPSTERCIDRDRIYPLPLNIVRFLTPLRKAKDVGLAGGEMGLFC